MKILVCANKGSKNSKVEELLEYLKDCNVEFMYSFCRNICEDGPFVFTLPELKTYGNVDKQKLDAIINGNSKDLEYNQEVFTQYNREYREDPMHKRTIKLFRWHLSKHDDISIQGLEEIIRTFQKKYDVKETNFMYPVKIALINSIKGPNIPTLINFMGKNSTMILFDEFLKKNV